MTYRAFYLAALLIVSGDAWTQKSIAADNTSPVQKVIELLQENKMKVQADLDAEMKEMAEYSEFCDSESSEKGYAIQTATRTIADLGAAILNGESQIAALEDEVSTVGTDIAEKERRQAAAAGERKKAQAEFQGTEKALVESVDQLSRAVVIIKRETSFVQQSHSSPAQKIKAALAAISKIVDAGWVNTGTKKALKGLMQVDAADDSDLKLSQPQAKVTAYESKSGGIIEQIEDMKEKAEETLSNARTAEMKAAHNYDMLAQSLNDAINVCKDKLSNAKSSIAAMSEENGKAKSELGETTRTKKSDEEYLTSLKQECTETASNWAERQQSAKEEMAVIEKAKSILADRVKVFVQVHVSGAKSVGDDDDDSDSKENVMRHRVVQKLKDLSHTFSSYALMEMVSVASADPFEKVRGLIEQMIAKLVTEANEEATQKAFCDEETAKSKKAQEEKSMTADKLNSRIAKASSTQAQLEDSVKELESEIAALDKGDAEATAIRTQEHATYQQASKDFKTAAEAVQEAIGVLKEYYEGSLIQTNSKSSKAPDFGGAKSDAASSIISILEMSEENFTKMYMQTETDEQEAARAYEKLMQENKVSKAAKQAEVKAAESEIKTLEVALKNNKEDLGMTSKELDAVMAYLEKLRPQCETKVMSYAEKKARREAEIAGLKEALEILDGPTALVQTRNLRAIRKA